MTDAMTADAKQTLTAGIPLERLGAPSDIAGMVAVLSSDLASYMTGQVIVVDGGLVM
jgi:3-oxoacyl-[acyl-carrier protein] reductase